MADSKGDIATAIVNADRSGNIDNSWNDEKRDEKVLTAEAQVGFADEKELGPWVALKAYPYAVMWSLVMATCVIMEGYDTALLGNFFAYRKGYNLLRVSSHR
jgi:SP family general alpha glucoside:H+ symporter-like MFS transporter